MHASSAHCRYIHTSLSVLYIFELRLSVDPSTQPGNPQRSLYSSLTLSLTLSITFSSHLVFLLHFSKDKSSVTVSISFIFHFIFHSLNSGLAPQQPPNLYWSCSGNGHSDVLIDNSVLIFIDLSPVFEMIFYLPSSWFSGVGIVT